MLKNKPFPKQLYSKKLTHCDMCPSVAVALKAMRLKDEQFAKEKQQLIEKTTKLMQHWILEHDYIDIMELEDYIKQQMEES